MQIAIECEIASLPDDEQRRVWKMARVETRKSPRPLGAASNTRDKAKPPIPVDYEALAHFRYGLRLFLAFSDIKAKNAGITSQQYQALLAIKGFSNQAPMIVGELSRLLLIKHHTAVELVDRMVQLKLLKRMVDEKDKRRVLVTLTKRGQLRLHKVAAINFAHLGSSSRMLRKVSLLLGSV